MAINVPTTKRCSFCDFLACTRPCAFVTRTEFVSAFINKRQHEYAATLIVPNIHLATALDLDSGLSGAIYGQAAQIGRALVRAFRATGLNIFQNNGVDAGQTEPHFHVHVVPRYAGGDPHKIFRSADVEPVGMDEQMDVARAICDALSAT